MDGKEAIKRLEKQYKRQNDYIKNSYDRVSITLPKGTKERIKAKGESINGLINRLVLEYLDAPSATDQTQPEEPQSHTEPPEDAQTVTASAEDPEELPPLDWSQLPEDLNDMTPEQAETIRRRCEARKAQETPPEPIPPEEWPFH